MPKMLHSDLCQEKMDHTGPVQNRLWTYTISRVNTGAEFNRQKQQAGNMAIPVIAPKVWTSLPDDVVSSASLSMFCHLLKTFFVFRFDPVTVFLCLKLVTLK